MARVAGRGDALAHALAGPGLRDTTRVAEDETIRPVLARNPAVAALTREVAAELAALADALDRGEPVDALLADAAAARRRLYPP
jgi:prephenate dehydrogenase